MTARRWRPVLTARSINIKYIILLKLTSSAGNPSEEGMVGVAEATLSSGKSKHRYLGDYGFHVVEFYVSRASFGTEEAQTWRSAIQTRLHTDLIPVLIYVVAADNG